MKVYRKFSPLYNLESGKFDTFVFTGGRGSLKTGSVCRAVLFDLMQHKNKRAVVFREIMRSINESLYAELTGLVDGEFRRRGFYYDSKTIRHRNGSKIFFMGLKDRNVWKRLKVSPMSISALLTKLRQCRKPVGTFCCRPCVKTAWC